MKPTPDTPQERDDKADELEQERDDKAEVLAQEGVNKAEVLEQDALDKAAVIAADLRRFRWEVRIYILVMFIIVIVRDFVS